MGTLGLKSGSRWNNQASRRPRTPNNPARPKGTLASKRHPSAAMNLRAPLMRAAKSTRPPLKKKSKKEKEVCQSKVSGSFLDLTGGEHEARVKCVKCEVK